jgi:hypothetical protein
MDALSVTETFAGFGAGHNVTLGAADQVAAATLSGSGVEVTYDAATGGYTVVAGARSQTFLPIDLTSADATRSQFRKTSATAVDQMAITVARPTSPSTTTPFRYVRLGAWHGSTVDSGHQESAAFGVPTPSGSVPRTGHVVYATEVFGYLSKPSLERRTITGSGVFNVDFGGGVFKTTTNIFDYDIKGGFGSFGGGVTLTGSGRLDSSGSFAGIIAYANPFGRTASGTLKGGFFGPAGEELGLSFAATGPGDAVMTGAMIGRREPGLAPETLSLTDVVANTTMRATFAEVSQYVDTAANPRFKDSIGGIVDYDTPLVTMRPDGSITIPGPNHDYYVKTYTAADLSPQQRPNFTSYDTTVSGFPARIEVYKPGSANTELQLSYASFASLQLHITSGTYVIERQRLYVFGLATERYLLASRTGTARYDGVVHGKTMGADEVFSNLGGTARFNVNFGGQTYDGQLALTATPVSGGASSALGTWTFGSTLSNGLMNQATLMKDGAPPVYWLLDGNRIQPAFYGPDGEEIAAAFTINIEPSSANPRLSHTGVVVARRQ